MTDRISRFAAAALLLFTLWAKAQPPEPRKDSPPVVAPQEFVWPEQVVTAFVDLISAHLDLEAAARLVEGGQAGAALKPAAAELQKERNGWEMELQDIDVQTKDNTASVKLRLRLHHPLLGKITHQERLTMHQVQNTWKIVPLSIEDFRHSFTDSFDSEILANIATYLARPQDIHEASAYFCVNNLKQLGLAAAQYIQDWDEKFAFKAIDYKQALMPYTRNEKIFHCPDDKSGTVSYSFNPNLANEELANIVNPAQFVMLYEGKNGQLDFRHDNRAGVCFVDGHVILVTPENAKNLKWKR